MAAPVWRGRRSAGWSQEVGKWTRGAYSGAYAGNDGDGFGHGAKVGCNREEPGSGVHGVARDSGDWGGWTLSYTVVENTVIQQ